jgi:hypothetical protein
MTGRGTAASSASPPKFLTANWYYTDPLSKNAGCEKSLRGRSAKISAMFFAECRYQMFFIINAEFIIGNNGKVVGKMVGKTHHYDKLMNKSSMLIVNKAGSG